MELLFYGLLCCTFNKKYAFEFLLCFSICLFLLFYFLLMVYLLFDYNENVTMIATDYIAICSANEMSCATRATVIIYLSWGILARNIRGLAVVENFGTRSL